jgi:hypothetical protein
LETLLDVIIGSSATVLGITTAFLGYLRFSRFGDIKERVSKKDYDCLRCILFFSSISGFLSFLSAIFIRIFSALNCVPTLVWLPVGLIIIQLLLTIVVIFRIARPGMKHIDNDGVNKDIIARIRKLKS